MKVRGPKKYFSTGNVAKICGVTINTVVKWYETGVLKGRRTSETGARRITRNSLFSFLRRRGYPGDTAVAERFRFLIVDDDIDVIKLITTSFRTAYGYMVGVADSNFEAGLLAERLKPHIVLISTGLKGVEPRHLAELLRASRGAGKAAMVAIGWRLGDKRREALSGHFDAILSKPLDTSRIREIIAGHFG